MGADSALPKTVQSWIATVIRVDLNDTQSGKNSRVVISRGQSWILTQHDSSYTEEILPPFTEILRSAVPYGSRTGFLTNTHTRPPYITLIGFKPKIVILHTN